MKAFQTTMQNSSASSKEVSMAVRGYGLFAAVGTHEKIYNIHVCVHAWTFYHVCF